MVDKDSHSIQSMFATIAPRYDLTNRILSARMDVLWRRHVARHLLDHPGTVLDLAAGTGDLSVALERIGHHRVVAADFTFVMLVAGRSKLQRDDHAVRPVGADALELPFLSGVFDAATVAFGVRNFADPVAGLSEIRRVLTPRGIAGILEFSRPARAVRILFDGYFRHVLPTLGGLVTGSKSSYQYLTASVDQFPEGEAFLDLMRSAGYEGVSATRLTGGIVTFYRGVNP